MRTRALRLALFAILAGAALVRLPHFSRPMADSLLAKQAYVANRARSIAQTPFNPLRSSLDFLDADGRRMAFTDEVPVYHTMLAIGYRLAGEHDWVGHALSLVGSLAALAAFFALVRREWDDGAAIIATIVLAAAPIFVFYGRAVLPEPWMLAMMLLAAASYRRYLDEGRTQFLVAASLAAMSAGLFKYFGLIVFIPLAEMAWRKAGSWRGVLSRPFLAMLAAALAPMAAWMGLVFFRTDNPVQSGWVDGQVMPYFVFQAPAVLLTRGFYANLFGRFLVRDCGPLTAALVVAGLIARVLARRGESREAGITRGWTVMAIVYYVLLAPKFRDHDYYELMMLPAAALWATRGLLAVASRLDRGIFVRVRLVVPDQCSTAKSKHWSGTTRGTLVAATLALLVVLQSPWILNGFFRQDEGKIALANRLESLCPPGARVVAIGPGIEFPTVIHYSHREGWPVHSPELPEDWRSRLDGFRASGAALVAVYFEPKATAAQRASYEPLIRALPIVESRSGLRTRSAGTADYVILDLVGPRLSRSLTGEDDFSRK
jgi:Dolichyl-phosphate-mannose-protein mannosyltransferase